MTDRHQIKPYPLRMPENLREKLETESNATGRSLHAEILARLESTFDGSLVSAEFARGKVVEAALDMADHMVKAMPEHMFDEYMRIAIERKLAQDQQEEAADQVERDKRKRFDSEMEAASDRISQRSTEPSLTVKKSDATRGTGTEIRKRK